MPSDDTGRPQALSWRSEMNLQDKPFSLAVATEDKDNDIIAYAEITSETRIAMMIWNAPALTAN
jgi:hypothetical protein